jgi:hypothetical protein
METGAVYSSLLSGHILLIIGISIVYHVDAKLLHCLLFCPDNTKCDVYWLGYKGSCYRFHARVRESVDAAAAKCRLDNAELSPISNSNGAMFRNILYGTVIRLFHNSMRSCSCVLSITLSGIAAGVLLHF